MLIRPMLAERRLPCDTARPANRRRARSVTVNLAESPLSWLMARGLVTPRQFAAGEQLREDYERGGLSPTLTMRWDAAPSGQRRSGGGRDPAAETHAMISAKQRFDAAIATAGPGLADILWRVVCAGDTMPVAEKALGWPARSGRLVLGLALDRVADHYRLR
jgi:hypothetical protein